MTNRDAMPLIEQQRKEMEAELVKNGYEIRFRTSTTYEPVSGQRVVTICQLVKSGEETVTVEAPWPMLKETYADLKHMSEAYTMATAFGQLKRGGKFTD